MSVKAEPAATAIHTGTRRWFLTRRRLHSTCPRTAIPARPHHQIKACRDWGVPVPWCCEVCPPVVIMVGRQVGTWVTCREVLRRVPKAQSRLAEGSTRHCPTTSVKSQKRVTPHYGTRRRRSRGRLCQEHGTFGIFRFMVRDFTSGVRCLWISDIFC